MDDISPALRTGNRLLDALSPASFARLRPGFERCELTFGDEIHHSGETASYVYFPSKGLISVLAVMADGTAVEIGVAGREGMFDIASILGDDAPSQGAIVQLPGSALRLGTRALRHAMEGDAVLRALLLGYARVTFSAVGQSAACNRLHMLEQRCARWLLMAHDRADGDTFPITHEFLAMMLGVRRAGVSEAAQALQNAGLISYRHGTMSILNRQGLEAASCECYQIIADQYDRHLGDSRQLIASRSQ